MKWSDKNPNKYLKQVYKSQGPESALLPTALSPTTDGGLADQRPLFPECEVWGIFTHSHLTATEGKHKPDIWLPFLPPLFSGFPFCG